MTWEVSMKLLILIPKSVGYFVLTFLWVCVNLRRNCNFFFCNRNTISQLFFRCSFIAADIFSKLNEFKLLTHGRNVTVQTAEDQVASVKLKFIFWYRSVQLNKFDYFDTINAYLEEECKAVSRCEIWPNWTSLTQKLFDGYFPPKNWLRNHSISSFQMEDFWINEYDSW
jgi:hypothetical protein